MIKNLFMTFSVITLTGGNFMVAGEVIETSTAIHPQERGIARIDEIINSALETFHIPGVAVGIVINGQVVLTKGYGVRDQVNALPVTEHTRFPIGSCTKAFTTHVLGQLVDEGKLSWDDKIVKYLPEFRLKDEYATYHMTIRDLVTHQSGLPRHDLAWYGSDSSKTDVLARLQHFDSSAELRSKFQYNNWMYAVAGIIIERITQDSWEEAVRLRILVPLGMNETNSSVVDLQQSENFSLPFHEKNGVVGAIPFRDIGAMGPAGGINSNVRDMTKWLNLQLSDGTIEGHSFIQTGTLKAIHTPWVTLGTYPEESSWFFGYGLGWAIGIREGRYFVTHGGGIDGFISSVGFLPKEKIGVVVLTNRDGNGVAGGLMDAIFDEILGVSKGDWIVKANEMEESIKAAKRERQDVASFASTGIICSLENYVGEFEHPGYGKVRVYTEGDKLFLSYNTLLVSLVHKCYDHFFGIFEAFDINVNCSFIRDFSGEVVELSMPLEPSLEAIVFKKNPSRELLSIDYLKQFEGGFESPMFSANIVFRGDVLIMSIIGSKEEYILIAERPLCFSLKQIPGSSICFVPGENGKMNGIIFSTPGAVINLVAKEK